MSGLSQPPELDAAAIVSVFNQHGVQYVIIAALYRHQQSR
jgi:hypothetical protein